MVVSSLLWAMTGLFLNLQFSFVSCNRIFIMILIFHLQRNGSELECGRHFVNTLQVLSLKV